MFQIMTPQEAAALVCDGDTIGINAFLSLANPSRLQDALAARHAESGHPNGLTLYCASGFGGWDERLCADPYIAAGAVKSIVAGHFMSMPAALRMISENKIEGYNMPLGVMAQMQRAAAGRQPGVYTRVGLNLFVDPRLEGPGLNERSKETWVKLVEVDGEELLFYRAPKFDVAFIRGTAADPNGNITFDKECVTADALSLAQATKANGGRVIVQVESLSPVFTRPRNVIVPGVLVDAVVVCPDQHQIIQTDYNPSLSGDIHVPPTHMDYWMGRLRLSGKRGEQAANLSHEIIGARAAKELRAGDVVNIGIGIPETVGPAAARRGLLGSLTLTVESGGIGGLPAPGLAFGATIGADVITDTSQQFDFYDGGGLDICFMGGFEVGSDGSVNAHRLPGRPAGIGGFANITQSTGRIVFCVNFTAGGLEVAVEDGKLRILREGRVRKFVKAVQSVSFSALNARRSGQRVLYVTERCVFRLGERGLEICEIAPGVDLRRDILDLLDFDAAVATDLKTMEIAL
ncbi:MULTISPECIES: acyl CoA:acetate/3-ketoacid CoA transferase [Anaerotruncus]|uniref:acyl CoA:acetate/3-ketoacid CoA transferase n=1 Tax=Anaerotruncus TaxID=244127 RepID=UPI0023EFAE5F|nr:CoA-transferase [Anaerotruncus massiliensis (ex Togo et al. 2019)]